MSCRQKHRNFSGHEYPESDPAAFELLLPGRLSSMLPTSKREFCDASIALAYLPLQRLQHRRLSRLERPSVRPFLLSDTWGRCSDGGMVPHAENAVSTSALTMNATHISLIPPSCI